MNLPLLNELLDNVIGYLDHKCLLRHQRDHIILAITITPNASDHWHLENRLTEDKKEYDIILWRKKSWLREASHREQLRRDGIEYNRVLEIRRERFMQLKRAICDSLGFLPFEEYEYDPIVVRMAEKILSTKKESSEQVFGVKLTDLPELPNKHHVKTEEGNYEL